MEVVLVEVKGDENRSIVRAFVDQPGGITLDDCERFSKRLSVSLDVEDWIPSSYTLEVSSPGLDRPLRGAADYRRFEGRLAKIVMREAVDNQKAFEGRLRGFDGSHVVLEAPNGRLHRLPLQLITRGRLEVEF
jgi:ribosome maturation factor RimP